MFFSKIEVLSEQEIDMIHNSSLEILREVGIRVQHEELLSLLSNVGAQISNGNVVTFLESVIEGVVKEMRSGTQNRKVKISDDLAHYVGWVGEHKGEIDLRSAGESLWAQDLDTGKIRPATKKDLIEATRLVDALPNVNIYMPSFTPQDVPVATRDVHTLEVMALNYSGWPRVLILNPSSIKYLVEMGVVIRGSMSKLEREPCFLSSVGMTSPLQFTEECAEVILKLCKLGLKNSVGMMYSMPVCGATGPVTLAGCLVLQNAEILALNLISRVLSIEYSYRPLPLAFDMSCGSSSEAAPESLLMKLASIQLMKYYGIPALVLGHFMATNSKQPDIQTGFEKAYGATIAALAGVRSLMMIGVLAEGDVSGLSQIVMDAEFGEMLNRILRGINFGKDELAVSLIKQVGIGGSFLTEEHTVKHFRKQLFLPTILDRRVLGSWLQDQKGMADHARSKVKKLLEGHCPEIRLDAAQIKEIRRITNTADKELG